MQQILKLHKKFDLLQKKFGDESLNSIYGAGKINKPKVMFIFMNPTGRNISSKLDWDGIRAPWIGTKQVWNILNDLSLLKNEIYSKIKIFKPEEWDTDFANEVYKDIEDNSAYITNLAKCTQLDARPLNNKTFKEYLDLMYEEIENIKPEKIVTFGNQVSSIILNKKISVSEYKNNDYELLLLKSKHYVYPTYYPVGQGRRNMPIAIKRIQEIMK